MPSTDRELQSLLDQHAITDCVRRWTFYRDGHRWAQLRDLYTADGRMTTTWTIASADEFVAHCKRMAEKGGGRQSMHSLGVTMVDINGDRAIAESRMTLLVRGVVDGVEVDITELVKFIQELGVAQADGTYTCTFGTLFKSDAVQNTLEV